MSLFKRQPTARRDEETDSPRVLSARFGVNPNSSSLGVDVTFLIFGGAAAVGAGLFLSALLRGRRAPVAQHGEEPKPTGDPS